LGGALPAQKGNKMKNTAQLSKSNKSLIRLRVVGLALFAVFALPLAPAQEIKLSDFAGKIEVTGNAGSLLSLETPEALYRGIERADRGDIRVFDAGGNSVPFLLRPLKGEITVPADAAVPVLVWNETTRRFSPNSFASNLEINSASGDIAVSVRPESERDAALYLADLSAVEYPEQAAKLIVSFDFSGDIHFNARVGIKGSDDLVNWEDSGKTQIAAYYNNPGVDRNEFSIPPKKYILLEFDGNVPPVSGAAVRFNPAESPAPLKKTSFEGTLSKDKKTASYNTAGHFPAKKIRFTLKEPASYRAALYSREDANADWMYIDEVDIFRIADAAVKESRETDIGYYSAPPLWKIESMGGHTFAETPLMELYWEGAELVFLASGKGPWTIAYGDALCEKAGESLAALAGEPAAPAQVLNSGYAKKGPGGFGQFVLWGSLGLAVILLTLLSVFIIKAMKS
jgi:hypothetical protein